MASVDYLTPDEVARICRVTRRTVYRWLEEGQLKAKRAGRGWRICRQQLDEFMSPKSKIAKDTETAD